MQPQTALQICTILSRNALILHCTQLLLSLHQESWKKVAVALAAIDRSLGIDLEVAMGLKRSNASNSASRLLAPADGSALDSSSPTASPSKLKSRAGPQSMFDAFKKWTMEHHTFSYVVLTDAEMATLSDGMSPFQFVICALYVVLLCHTALDGR
jgi:hypothetical protein